MKNIKLNEVKHIHMVGIGGIGMSGLANVLTDRNIFISGSDLKNNCLIEKLKKKGCKIRIGHKGIYGTPDLLVRSFGVKENNPEVNEAREKQICVITRSELLKRFIDTKKYSISVTGTHGKTTTTAMISYLLDRAGLDPTVLIGGEMDYFKGNSKSGTSEILVSETDESDGYFREIVPRFKVITNIEKEHMEYYRNMSNLVKAFKAFIANTPSDGILFYNSEDRYLQKLSGYCHGKRISFGISPRSDFYATSIEERGLLISFYLKYKRKGLGKVTLNFPGRHNVLNAMASIAVALECGISFRKAGSIMRDFKGIKRRFEIKSRTKDLFLIEDYAHHPTELKAVIGMARALDKKRIIAVFQPHRYSRTMYLRKEFNNAFTGVDELILTDIYAANEPPMKGVDVRNICDGVRRKGIKSVKILEKALIARYLRQIVRRDDVILILGAGNINEIVPEVMRNIAAKGKGQRNA